MAQARQRAIIYCRVSTKKQAREDRFSLPEQVQRCERHCEGLDYDVLHVLKEVHTGAELDERPEMTKLREMMRRREVDVVVMVVLDRLARNQNHQEVILYYAEKYGVRVELTEEVFEDTPVGRHMRSLAGFVNELERDRIRDRTERGRAQRVRQGNMIPGRVPLYGYQWADPRKTHYLIHPVTGAIARRIFEDAANGKPLRRISLDLTIEGALTPGDQFRADTGKPTRGDAWAKSTIWNILNHPAYYGKHSAYRWEVKKRRDIDEMSGESTTVLARIEREVGEHRIELDEAAPALITEEIALAVAKRLEQNKLASARNNRHPEIALLRGGFVKCGLCNGNMVVTYIQNDARTANVPVYRCSRARANGSGSQKCRGASISVHILDAAVWGRLITFLQNSDELEQAMRTHIQDNGVSDDIEALTKRIESLDRQQSSIRRAIALIDDENDENIARFVADLKSLGKQKQSATEERRSMERRQFEWKQYQSRIHDVKLWCRTMAEHGDDLSYEDKRIVLYGMNVVVTVYPHGNVPRYTIKASSNDSGITVLDTHDDKPGGNGSIGDIVSRQSFPGASRASGESFRSTLH